jgi:choline dehydrogenase-like flavoprotein
MTQTTRYDADVAIVGAGVAGCLVARACLRQGRSVTMVERGGRMDHAEQLRTGRYETGADGARHNHEIAEGSPEYPWSYVYGVGGSCLHWTGHSPRLLADDLRMRSRHGVMEDWPLALDELEPYYEQAEEVLAVAGAPDPRHGGPGGQPAHPLSPMDRAVAPFLAPFGPLPGARPSRPAAGRPPCCGSATCELCPVDSRFSVLNGLADVLVDDGLELVTDTVAARLRMDGRKALRLEAVGADRAPVEVRARTYVLAASGFENPALLLRSGLDREATGRFLYDHAHRTIWVTVREPVGAGRGASIATGQTLAFRTGGFRSDRSAALALLFNPGIPVGELVARELASGRGGASMRRRIADRWARTLPFDVLLEDVPRPERRVTLSPKRDAFGLPLVRVAYPAVGPYEEAGYRATRDGIVRRLAPLGVEAVEEPAAPAGAHLLGTCRMGDGDTGVVDRDLRHLDTDDVYVVGGSAMPTYSPSHPTLTIAALAIRAGETIARR